MGRADHNAQMILDGIGELTRIVTSEFSALKISVDVLEHRQTLNGGYLSEKPSNADSRPTAIPSAALEEEVENTQQIGQLANQGETRMPMPPDAPPKTIGDVSELPKPFEHTSAARELLRWPWIQKLFSQSPTPYNGDYAMDLEETRGLLRLNNRGDDAYLGDDGQPDPPSVKSEEQVSRPTAFPESLCRTFESLSGGDFRKPAHESVEVGPHTVNRLLRSYLDNIHNLHPFLNKDWLHESIEEFVKNHNLSDVRVPQSPLTATEHIDALCWSATKSNKTMKRTFSNMEAPSSSTSASSTASTVLRPLLEWSVNEALILLVLALGKISEWKNPPPGFLGHGSSKERIPGLAYYDYATHILANWRGSNDLTYIQANLLAGLYAGQCARVYEGWSWINSACTACQVLIRP